MSLPWNATPQMNCNWTSFDVPDISLTPGITYYIVLTFAMGGDYNWCGAWNNPYPPGESNRDPDWDWTFRTYYEEIPEECCLKIERMTGGLFAPTASLKIDAEIKKIGTAECKDIEWKFTTSGGICVVGNKERYGALTFTWSNSNCKIKDTYWTCYSWYLSWKCYYNSRCSK